MTKATCFVSANWIHCYIICKKRKW